MADNEKGSKLRLILTILFGMIAVTSGIYVVYHFNKRLDRIEEKFEIINQTIQHIGEQIKKQSENGQGGGIGSFFNPSGLADAASKLSPINQASEAAKKTLGAANETIGNLNKGRAEPQKTTS